MIKKSYLIVLLGIFVTTNVNAASPYNNKNIQRELSRGLDVYVAPELAKNPDIAYGELGENVYEYQGTSETKNIQLYIPTSMYVRMGAGINLNLATEMANYFGTSHKTTDSYTYQIGMGWNLSSYVRTELDFQTTSLKFQDLKNLQANYNTFGGTLYFDLARRYILSGDITHRRTFVPFMGIGAAVGTYEFQGPSGADGFVIAAPRAVFGVNIMFNDLIGIDIAYQYQMMIGNGFGWGASNGGANDISNIMATIRANF